jgi:hypothetical protein
MPDPKGNLVTPVGFDASDDPRSLEVDADDALRVALETAAKGLVGLHGWFSGSWQKAPIPWGFSGQVKHEFKDLNTGAGAVTVSSTTVPAGEIWRLTFVTMLCVSATCTNMWTAQRSATIGLIASQIIPPVSAQWYSNVVDLVLIEGESMEVNGLNMTAGDTLYLQFSGYRVDIDQ